MATPRTEREPEHGLSASDDFHSHQERLIQKSGEAADIINEYEHGGERRAALLKRLKGSPELAMLIQSLTQLRDAELERNGLILQMDLADGTYDNATTDRKLNTQINWLSNLNIDLNRMFGTRTARKVMGWFTRTMPNWMGVEWMVFKDNMKNLLLTAGMVGAAGAAITVGGYALAYGGFTPGMAALGSHLTPALSSVQSMLAAAGGAAAAGWNWLFGKKAAK